MSETNAALRILSYILFLLSAGWAFSQNPYYHIIDKSSGLPSNTIYDIFQDSKGFMWFATGKGLCRYDGNSIKTFTADFQTSKSGSCIKEDPYGRIWYENFDGNLYYVEKGKLKSINQPASSGFLNYGIIRNKLFAIKANQLFIYNLKTLAVEKKIALGPIEVRGALSDEDKYYVLGKKLYEFDENGNHTETPLPENKRDFDSPILQSTGKTVFITSKYSNTYYLYKDGFFTKKVFPFTADFIQNIGFIDSKYWLCTTKGVFLLNLQTNESKNYFKGDNISYVFMDNQRNYWVSTLNKGLYLIENFDTKLYELSPMPLVLASSKDGLFIGTDKDEIYKMNLLDNKIASIYKGSSNHSINQLTYDNFNKQLFFTSSKFKNLKGNIRYELPFSIKNISRIDMKYFSFAATGNSGIFCGDETEKSAWDAIFTKNKIANSENFHHAYLIKNYNSRSTAYNPVNKTIYYATNNGLIAQSLSQKKEIKFNNKTIYFTKLKYFNSKLYGVSNNEKVYTINRFNRITPYTLPEGLKNDKIEKIDLENNSLFLFTATAIYEVNLITNQFRKAINLTPDIDITDLSFINNKIYFASSKGIIVKEINRYKAPVQPKLIINELLVNDQNLELDPVPVLDHDQNDIKINFSVLSFIPNEKYDIFYKINNSKWNVSDFNNRSLILSSLSPGTYKITLKVGTDNNKLSEQEIEFTIKKPLWLSPVVIVLAVALLLSLAFFYYKWQIEKIEKRNLLLLDKINLEKNLNQSKLKAVKSQMNPHFFYNALNTIQSYILSNDKKQAVNYLSKFSRLTRTILEMTEKETVSVSEEIKTLQLYLDIEKARFEDDFHYEINVDSQLDAENIKIPSMLLQPYVENAVKHGLLHKQGKKVLRISFENTNGDLQISIDDNGIGRKKSAKLNAVKNKNHQSFATKATQNRLELLNQYTHQNISVTYIDKTGQNNEPQGTTVIFIIPVTN